MLKCASTNMHDLTGLFYSVSKDQEEILHHAWHQGSAKFRWVLQTTRQPQTAFEVETKQFARVTRTFAFFWYLNNDYGIPNILITRPEDEE